ncbi:MAG: GAF domain-containing protein [Cyanobacteria bacterium J06648_16]
MHLNGKASKAEPDDGRDRNHRERNHRRRLSKRSVPPLPPRRRPEDAQTPEIAADAPITRQPTEPTQPSPQPPQPPTSNIKGTPPPRTQQPSKVNSPTPAEPPSQPARQPAAAVPNQTVSGQAVSKSPGGAAARPVETLPTRTADKTAPPPINRPHSWRRWVFKTLAYGTLPTLLLIAGAYVLTNRTVTQRAAQSRQAQATEVAQGLKRFMGERVQDIQMLASLPDLKQAVQPSQGSNAAALRQRGQQQLDQFNRSLGSYRGLAVVDLQGRVLFQTAGVFFDRQASEPYFSTAVESGLPAISPGLTSQETGEAVVYVAAPIRNAQGNSEAVVLAQLSAEALADAIAPSDTYWISDQQQQPLLQSGPPAPTPLRISDSGTSVDPALQNGWLLLKQLVRSETVDAQAITLTGTAQLTPTPTLPLDWQVTSALTTAEALSLQRHALGTVALISAAITALLSTLMVLTIKRANQLVQQNVQELQQQLNFWQQRQVLSKERSRLLTEIVEHMRRSLREEDILNTTVSELRYALNTDRVIVYRFLDDWTGKVIAESVALGWRKILGEFVKDPLREGLIERYRNGRVRAMNDIYTENLTQCHQDILSGFQIHASIVAPIVQNDRLVGLLCAHQCSGARQWQEEDIDLFAKLSSQLGYVLDQAALQQRQTLSVDRSRLLTEIVNTMRRSQREEEILNNTVSELRYALNTDRVIVYRFLDDWTGKVVAESVALGQRKILGEYVNDPMREGFIERYRNGRVRVMNDIYTENLTQCHQDILEGFQIRASIVAPILQNGQLIGLICAHHCNGPREWHSEDVDLFGKLATQLGFALDQAAILQKQIRSAEKSRLQSEIVGNMRRSMTREGVLNTTVSELRYALNTDRVIVYEFHDDWNGTIIAESVSAGWRKLLGETVQDPFREGLIERYRNGRVRSMDDIQTENLTQCHQDILEGFQIRASIVAPVLQNGQLIGLLCAHHCSGPRQWQEEQIDLMTQLSTQLGFALDQTALLEYTEKARQEARQEADAKTAEQRQQKEFLQQRAKELLQDVHPVSRGDLTVRARVSDDELGTIAASYNTILESFRQIVTQVQTASQSVSETASKNETAVNHLSQDSRRQLQAINGVLSQIQAMVESIQGVSDRSQKAESIVLAAATTIEAGDEAMNRTVSGMSDIRETVSETAKKVKRLGEASQKVSRVVSVVNGFAAQTNLLALNAAVEASRAGEEGQGFRVVAEEVRDLAQQSAQATEEIAHLVEEMQAQTNEVVSAMENGTDQVVTGTRLVEASRQQLSQISQVSAQISQLVREISQAAAAQTDTSTAVSQTMQDIAAIADQTSTQSEAVSNSFDHLLKVAQELQVSVSQFKLS